MNPDTKRAIPRTDDANQHKVTSSNHKISQMPTFCKFPKGMVKETKHIFNVARLVEYTKQTTKSLILKSKENSSTLVNLAPNQQLSLTSPFRTSES